MHMCVFCVYMYKFEVCVYKVCVKSVFMCGLGNACSYGNYVCIMHVVCMYV